MRPDKSLRPMDSMMSVLVSMETQMLGNAW